MSSFDLYEVAKNYLLQILDKKDPDQSNTSKGNHIKVLLLDNDTSEVISLVSTQSELLRHDIYLIDKLENTSRDNLRNLDCLCFLKPSDSTISNLSNELSIPKYHNYQVYFNNIISQPQLEKLAEADNHESVSKVAEIFQDYFTINKALFTSIKIDNCLSGESPDRWDIPSLDSSLDSVLSMLLSLKLKPVIRYESNSGMGLSLASSISSKISENTKLFDDVPSKDVSPLLLILDRKNDPITPLLFPWTYQSMIHEIFGIQNNTVDLSNVSNVSKELETVVLNENQDSFYKQSMYSNFGELSNSLKQYIEKYKERTKSNSNINTIKDMKFFLENYPEFKKTSLNVSKHMLLSSEIDSKINTMRMWEVSEFEQTLVSNSDRGQHNTDLKQLEDLLFNRKNDQQGKPLTPLSNRTKAKLLALYALKYEGDSNNQTLHILRQLKKLHFPEEYIRFINGLLKYAGSSKRLADNEGSIFERVANSSSTIINGLTFNNHGDSSNVYMQHIPRLQSILAKVSKCNLDTTNYPYVKGNKQEPEVTSTGDKVPPQEIIIFVVGGVTYEEARLVAQLNQANSALRCVIGGTNIVNTDQFMNNVIDVASSWGVRI